MPPTNGVNNVWASKADETNNGEEITLPSGQVCLVHKIGIEQIVEAGVLLDMETLTSLVAEGPVEQGQLALRGHQPKAPTKAQTAIQVKIAEKKAAEAEAAAIHELMTDPTKLAAIIGVADKLTPYIVMDPVVNRHWKILDDGTQVMIPRMDRAPGVYTDDIQLEDKLHLLEYGVADLSALGAGFQPGSETSLGTLDA